MMMKHHDQKIVGTERVFCLTLQHCCSLLKEVRKGTQEGQDPGGKN